MGAKTSTSNLTKFDLTLIICAKDKSTLKTITRNQTEKEVIATVDVHIGFPRRMAGKFIRKTTAREIDTLNFISDYDLQTVRPEYVREFMKKLTTFFEYLELDVKRLKYQFNWFRNDYLGMIFALRPSIIEPVFYFDKQLIFQDFIKYWKLKISIKLNHYRDFYRYFMKSFISIDICCTELAEAEEINYNIAKTVRYACLGCHSVISMDGRMTMEQMRLLTLMQPRNKKAFCGNDGGDFEDGETCVLSAYGYYIKSFDNMAVIFTGRGEVFKLFIFKVKDKEDLNTKIREKVDSYFREHDDWKSSMLESFVEDFFAE